MKPTAGSVLGAQSGPGGAAGGAVHPSVKDEGHQQEADGSNWNRQHRAVHSLMSTLGGGGGGLSITDPGLQPGTMETLMCHIYAYR